MIPSFGAVLWPVRWGQVLHPSSMVLDPSHSRCCCGWARRPSRPRTTLQLLGHSLLWLPLPATRCGLCSLAHSRGQRAVLHSPKQSNVVDSTKTVQNSKLQTSPAADNLAACTSLSRSRPTLVELRVWLRNQLSKTGRSAEVIGRSAIADLAVGYRRDPQASMVAGDLRARALLEALSCNVHGVGPDRGAREPRWEAERQFTRESQSTIGADLIHNRVCVPESSKSLNL